jgi:transcription factor Dp-1
MQSTANGNWSVEGMQQEGIFSYSDTSPNFNQLDGSESASGAQPATLHEEILRLCRETGVEDLAKKAGLIQNNEITELKNYDQVALDAKGLNTPSSTPTSVPSNSTPNTITATLGGSRGRKRKSPSRSVSPSRTNANSSSYNNPPSLSSSQQSGGGSSQGSSQETEAFEEGKRRGKTKVDKSNKGLRHFSRKVCEKVEQKKVTTYNEVADELVAEFNSAPEKAGGSIDQKNIRRRVYDALNVLMAMNIIKKDKKEIRWIGLPATNAKEEVALLQAEKEKRLQRIRKKKEYLQELEAQQTLYKNLLARNMMRHTTEPENERIFLPFIVIHTKKQTQIDCEMSEDKTEYFFDFTLPFSIHDDNEILKRMGLANPPTPPPSVPIPSNTSGSSIPEGGVILNATTSNSLPDSNSRTLNTVFATPGKSRKHVVLNPSSSPLNQGTNNVVLSPQQTSLQSFFPPSSQPQTPLKNVQSLQSQMNAVQSIDPMLLSVRKQQEPQEQHGSTSSEHLLTPSSSNASSTNSSMSSLNQEDLSCGYYIIQNDSSNDTMLQPNCNEEKHVLIETPIGPK